jgi:hypothetical protein
MAKAFRYQHLRSLVNGVEPSTSLIREGEIAVNLYAGNEKMFLKNTNDQIVRFITEAQVDAKIQSQSGSTDRKVEVLSGAIDTNTANISALDSSKFGAVFYDKNAKKINFYGKSTTGSVLGEIDTTDFVKDGMIDSVELVEASGNTYLRITWNTDAGKDVTDLNLGDIFDADNYYTKAQADELFNRKVDKTAYNTYTAVTATEIGNKANASDVYKKTETYTKSETDTAINTATSGKVDTSTYNTYTGNTATALNGKQETLVSGTNIKTVVNKSLLGSGNVDIDITELTGIIVDGGNTVILDAGTF